MSAEIATVEAFFAECGKGPAEMHDAYERYFTPSTIWENVGMPTTSGAAAALKLMRKLEAKVGFDRFSVEMLFIAQQGTCVLTERVDRLYDAAGASIRSIRIMGILKIEEGKIARWSDYF